MLKKFIKNRRQPTFTPTPGVFMFPNWHVNKWHKEYENKIFNMLFLVLLLKSSNWRVSSNYFIWTLKVSTVLSMTQGCSFRVHLFVHCTTNVERKFVSFWPVRWVLSTVIISCIKSNVPDTKGGDETHDTTLFLCTKKSI